ncbi:hypothetical protein BJ508DRAFT_333966 [Ascobolus immersus RN42]|uniref:Uncharacterized protein n=1 Tax=Ascobolus immersus RN42 TaxID=1160509 RepID=A0A3N4HP26_ASCIM|nr:hypothetical protein BJ508DRAFT_333966 [Ascobolus immersus RN42]
MTTPVSFAFNFLDGRKDELLANARLAEFDMTNLTMRTLRPNIETDLLTQILQRQGGHDADDLIGWNQDIREQRGNAQRAARARKEAKAAADLEERIEREVAAALKEQKQKHSRRRHRLVLKHQMEVKEQKRRADVAEASLLREKRRATELHRLLAQEKKKVKTLEKRLANRLRPGRWWGVLYLPLIENHAAAGQPQFYQKAYKRTSDTTAVHRVEGYANINTIARTGLGRRSLQSSLPTTIIFLPEFSPQQGPLGTASPSFVISVFHPFIHNPTAPPFRSAAGSTPQPFPSPHPHRERIFFLYCISFPIY